MRQKTDQDNENCEPAWLSPVVVRSDPAGSIAIQKHILFLHVLFNTAAEANANVCWKDF